MISPLDALKVFINLKSYLTWFLIATTVFGLFCFIKNKFFHNQNTTTLKSYFISFLIILALFSFLYLSFFHKTEPSSKYTGQLIEKIDGAIKKYDDTINNYNGLKKDWEKELEKCEKELKDLYEQKEIIQEAKDKIKEALDRNEGKIKEIKEKLSKNTENITILKGKLLQLEQDKEAKEKEIKQKQEEEKLASPDDKIRLQALISKLQGERREIMEQIAQVSTQIADLEATQKSLTAQLGRAEEFKKGLIQNRDDLSKELEELSTIITTWEDRKAEIQKNIDEVNQKLEEINLKKELYESLKLKYKDMYNRMLTYEEENKFSFGNAIKAAFKAFDKVTDLIPAKYGLKVIGKTMTVTRKFAQGMGKATLVLHEGHRLWHMYNEVINENKEHPPMITKEALEMYTRDIDRDLDKLDADYKDHEKKLEEYQKSNNEATIKAELKDWKDQNKEHSGKIKQKWKDWIDEYEKINEELTKKLNKVSGENAQKLILKENELRELHENKVIEIENTQEELKQKNPSYARAQQRIQARRVGKIPEMVMIPNK
ncbi:DNA double-strand break repair protein Rad50 [Mulberry dwarf phytoplasma]|uniref:DNA double-strand break repair protein Rad50 n=1 Tax=Mulberry dwarf phytoplasma TaxID=186171 RepID=UPI001D123FD7|nr:DNA double-strand break repair protein Rad50 [Mulberry dwarf phytoplasma]